MNETPFDKTRMGQVFYVRTMPELVKQLERLNELLERLTPRIEQENGEPKDAG